MLLLNSANGISEFNRSLGFDAGLVLGRYVTLDQPVRQDVLSRPDQPGDCQGSRLAGVVDFCWKNDKFNYGAQYQDIGEHFNAEMGYIPRIDIRAGKAKAGWTPRPKWKGVRQLVVQRRRRLLREPRRPRRIAHAGAGGQPADAGHVGRLGQPSSASTTT